MRAVMRWFKSATGASRSVRRLLACLVAVLLAAPVAVYGGNGTQSQYVQTMTFQDGVAPTSGYAGSEFTFICSAAADSGKNFGAADTLYVSNGAYTGPFHAGFNKMLGKFDISALPDSAVIVRARIWLYQIGGATGTTSDTLQFSRIYPPWTEGTGAQAGTASVASATWTTRHANDSPADVFTGGAWFGNGATLIGSGSLGAFWISGSDSSVTPSMSGADTADVKISSLTADITAFPFGYTFAKTGAPATSKAGWVAVDCTRQVRLWHIGANTNNGFLVNLHNNVTSNKAFKYFSDNYANKSYRPKLVVEYVDPETLESSGTGSVRRVVGGRR